MWTVPPDWKDIILLALGSNEYLYFVLPKLKHHRGPFVYSTDIVFKNRRPRDLACLYAMWSSLREGHGLISSVVTHAEFGSVTSAFHLLSYQGVEEETFLPQDALPRAL